MLFRSNIPFLGTANPAQPSNPTNANAFVLQSEATFWIETVQPDQGHPFQLLQYSQTVTLNFLGIDWPHISVATLYRQ